jgi:thioesterase-3
MKKTPQSTVRVRFQDCDPFNHLNNSKYLDYFINAREDQLMEHYELDIFKLMKQTGKVWVVGSNQIMYLKPALTMEEVLIETALIAYSSKMLTVEMTMWDHSRAQLKAILWAKFMHVDLKTNRSTDHSEELEVLFRQIVVPVKTTVFEERCRELMQELKSTAAE